jgi:alpha,alpha-trehalase
LPQLKREYAFWMAGAAGLHAGAAGLHAGAAAERVVVLPDGATLNRYWDDNDTPRDESYGADTELARTSGREPRQLYRDIRAAAESGWDFSSRWFADGRTSASIDTTEIIPVDLNSLMYGLEQAIRAGCERSGERDCAIECAGRAAARREAINRYLWNARVAAFVDYRWSRGVQSQQLTAATLYPLFVNLASPQQAVAVAKTVAQRLLKVGGIVTTNLNTGQQWDAPNGWAPLQWIAISGLRDYQQGPLAESIACRWMASVNAVYERSGKLVEKYDVVTPGRRGGGGEYPTQDGFGWTNGVMRELMQMYPAEAGQSQPGKCPRARVRSAETH